MGGGVQPAGQRGAWDLSLSSDVKLKFESTMTTPSRLALAQTEAIPLFFFSQSLSPSHRSHRPVDQEVQAQRKRDGRRKMPLRCVPHLNSHPTLTDFPRDTGGHSSQTTYDPTNVAPRDNVSAWLGWCIISSSHPNRKPKKAPFQKSRSKYDNLPRICLGRK